MIRALLWKEWHEQRWKLAFATVMLAGATAIGLDARIVPDQVVLIFVCLLGGLGGPLLVSMGLFAAERHDGSLPVLLRLPVPVWTILAVKLAMGAAACVVPLLAAGIIATLAAGGRELAIGRILALFAGTIGFALAYLLWMLAASIRQPTEARAALVSIGIVIASFLVLAVYSTLNVGSAWGAIHPFAFLFLGLGGNFAARLAFIAQLLLDVAAQLLIAAALCFWMVRRLSLPDKVRS